MFTDMHYVDTTPISQSEQEQMRWEGPCTLTRHWRHCDAFMHKKKIGHGSWGPWKAIKDTKTKEMWGKVLCCGPLMRWGANDAKVGKGFQKSFWAFKSKFEAGKKKNWRAREGVNDEKVGHHGSAKSTKTKGKHRVDSTINDKQWHHIGMSLAGA